MNTWQIVLITIVAVHLVNLIVLALDENCGWKYEDWAKRFTCLTVWIALIIIMYLPFKVRRLMRRGKVRYNVLRTFNGEWNFDHDIGIYSIKKGFKHFSDAFRYMLENVEKLKNNHVGDPQFDNIDTNMMERSADGLYIFSNGSSTIRYEIVKYHVDKTVD